MILLMLSHLFNAWFSSRWSIRIRRSRSQSSIMSLDCVRRLLLFTVCVSPWSSFIALAQSFCSCLSIYFFNFVHQFCLSNLFGSSDRSRLLNLFVGSHWLFWLISFVGSVHLYRTICSPPFVCKIAFIYLCCFSFLCFARDCFRIVYARIILLSSVLSSHGFIFFPYFDS